VDRTVTVSNALPPTLFVEAPAAGATVSGTLPVSGWAIDNASKVETAIAKVEVFVDGTKVGDATYGTPRADVCAVWPGRPGCPNVGFSYNWNTAAFADGPHVLRVMATDSDAAPHTAIVDRTVTIGNGTH
jgi:hypothetical protein